MHKFTCFVAAIVSVGVFGFGTARACVVDPLRPQNLVDSMDMGMRTGLVVSAQRHLASLKPYPFNDVRWRASLPLTDFWIETATWTNAQAQTAYTVSIQMPRMLWYRSLAWYHARAARDIVLCASSVLSVTCFAFYGGVASLKGGAKWGAIVGLGYYAMLAFIVPYHFCPIQRNRGIECPASHDQCWLTANNVAVDIGSFRLNAPDGHRINHYMGPTRHLQTVYE